MLYTIIRSSLRQIWPLPIVLAVVGTLLLSSIVVAPPIQAASTAIHGGEECNANVLGPNDDRSSSVVDLPFTLDFFGTDHDQLWVNNNGNVTFDGPQSDYTCHRPSSEF
jgi:hypothetical protein